MEIDTIVSIRMDRYIHAHARIIMYIWKLTLLCQLVLPSFRFGMGNCRVKYIAIPTTNCRGTLLHPTTKLMVHKESVTHPTIVATGASNQHLRAQTTRRTNSVCATSHVRTCVLKDAQILISTRIIPCCQTCTHTCMRMPLHGIGLERSWEHQEQENHQLTRQSLLYVIGLERGLKHQGQQRQRQLVYVVCVA